MATAATAGAITRRAVRPTGRGTSVPTRTTDQAAHARMAAARRTGSLWGCTAAPRAGPTVKGRITQTTRSNH